MRKFVPEELSLFHLKFTYIKIHINLLPNPKESSYSTVTCISNPLWLSKDHNVEDQKDAAEYGP